LNGLNLSAVSPPHASSAPRDWGEPLALLAAGVLSLALPNRYTIGGPALTVVLGIVLAGTCALSFYTTIFGSRTATRRLVKISAGILAIGLVTSLSNIVYLVVYKSTGIEGTRLLETALFIWASNVIIFAIIYHWIGDREYTFPRLDGDATPLNFLDYVFLSFTTSTAFSPTDTPPLTTRARMYMMLESAISLITIAIAAARAVNILT